MNTSSKTRGFTFLELLIVIAIMGVLLAILVPAVQQVREAARRTQCLNNARQLVLSMLNYESAYQHLPPATGYRGAESDTTNTTARYSGFLSFFMFTERYPGPPIGKELELDGKIFPAYPDVDTANYPMWSRQSYLMLCPNIEPNSDFAEVHYGLSIGDVGKNVHSPNEIRGSFAVGMEQKLKDITDGSSSTLAIAEIGGNTERGLGRRFAINQPESFLTDPKSTSNLVDRYGRYRSEVELSPRIRGGNWADGIGGPGLVNTILPPGSPSLLVGGDSRVDGFFSASVNHEGGTVTGFLDGSTHFVGSDIDTGSLSHNVNSAEELAGRESHYGVWGALGSCNGNDDTPEF